MEKTVFKHRSLLPLCFGQPVVMTILAAVVGLLLCALGTVLLSAFQLAQQAGISPFLPSANTWKAIVLCGVGVGLFNVACESVQVDISKGLKRNSWITLSLLVASCSMLVGTVDYLLTDTMFHSYLRTYAGGLGIGVLFSWAGMTLLKIHRKDLTAMFM